MAQIRLLLQEQSDLSPHCLSKNEASNILVDDKKHTFCDYALYGLINVISVCIL